MSQVRKALGYSVFSSWLSRGLNMASIVLIARLLTPEELGVFAIASAITLIASELKSFGVGGYLIREDKIDSNKVANALGLSMLLSWGAGITIILSSWAVAAYYEMPNMALLVQFLSISFFLSPHIGIGKSLLDRNFKFEQKMLAEISSQVFQFASAIGFIYMGHSYMSLAYSNAIGFAVELLVILIIIRPEFYTIKPAFNNMKGIAKFGVYVTSASFITSLNGQMTALIIGKIGSTTEVAFLSRASGFINFLSGTITSGIKPVVTPYLANKKRNGEQFAEAYSYASDLLTSIVVPALAVAGIASLPVIAVFFGDQWIESAPIVSLLCISAGIHFLNTLSPSLLITGGHEKLLLKINSVMLCAGCTSIYFIYPYGYQYIPLGGIVTQCFRYAFLAYFLQKHYDLNALNRLKNLLPMLVLTAACSCWALSFDAFIIPFSVEQAFLIVPLLGVSTFIVWLATVFVISHPLKAELIKIFERKTTK